MRFSHAHAAISTRLRASSLVWIPETWLLTVLSEMNSSAAISRLVRPRAISRTTSRPNLVRPHLMPPVTIDKAMTEDAINEARGLGSITNGASVKGLTIPDAWVTDVSDLRTSDGRTLDSRTFNDCLSAPNDPAAPATGRFGAAARCLGDLHLHVAITYQPYHRYWPFQVLESGLYLLVAGLLTLFGRWRIQRRTT
jgi:hypothetical protein